MTESPLGEILSREPRMEITDSLSANVVMRRKSAGQIEALPAELLDLSRGGAKLSVPKCLPFDEPVSLSISILELNLEFDVAAEIAWSRPNDGGTWHLGCSFNPPIPDEITKELAAGGYLERRKNPRYIVSLDATVCWELTDRKDRVTLENFSIDGYCMRCAESGEPGQRLLLYLDKKSADSDRAISAKVQWSVKEEDGFFIGCTYLNGHDFNFLWEVAVIESPDLVIESKPTPKWVLAWFAAIVGFIIAYPILVPFLSGNRPGQVLVDTGNAVDQPIAAIDTSVSRPGTRSDAVSDAEFVPLPDPNAKPADDVAKSKTWESNPSIGHADLERRASELVSQAEKLAAERAAFEVQRDAYVTERAQQLQELKLAQSRIDSEKEAWDAERMQLLAEKAEWTAERERLTKTGAMARTDDHLTSPPALPAVVAANDDQPTEVPIESPSSEPTPSTAGPSTGSDPHQALDAFVLGRSLYSQGQYDQAARQWEVAARLDDTKPLYRYLLALAQRQANRVEDARKTVHQAVALERNHPVVNWGRTMERFQGSARLWLESTRQDALRTNDRAPESDS